MGIIYNRRKVIILEHEEDEEETKAIGERLVSI